MFREPRLDLVGKFDIVHVRLITLVIKNNDPLKLITNLRKLLSEMPKPVLSDSHR